MGRTLLAIALLGVVALALATWLDRKSGGSANQPPNPLQRFGEVPTAGRTPPTWESGAFAPRRGEIVAILGATNAVRAQRHGALEARLATAFADAEPRYRHMGWDGDTVFEQKRYQGFGSLVDQLAWAGADAAICWFGKMEVLDRRKNAEAFIAAYGALLDQLAAHTRRIAILGPTPFEPPPHDALPSHVGRNDDLARRVELLRGLAAQRGLPFVDLFAPLRGEGRRWTDDGIHLDARGLDRVAELVAEGLAGNAGDAPTPELLAAIATKNEYWDACWRPANWSFIYGDLTDRAFAEGTEDAPALARELEEYKDWITRADARVLRLAAGDDGGAPVHVVAEPATTTRPPEEQRATFDVLDGYRIELFASEADGLIQPVDMAWDERGRLWIACTPTYPQLVPGQLPDDYILVCEDTDGDGRIDRTHRFAENLHIPLGIAPGDGGLYVCEYSRFLHLRDTDGDGRADRTEILAQGFGTEDSHEMLSTPIWGPTGELLFGQGNNIFSRVETVHGIVELQGGGFWRYRPRTREWDGFMGFESAGLNPRTAAFNTAGQPFVISGGSGRGSYVLSGMVRDVRPKLVPDWLFDPRSKGTGMCFVESSHFPDEMQDVAVIGGFIANAIELNRMIESGSGYDTESLEHLVASSGPEFRVVDVSIGPDGALYALDLYSKVITHYRAPLRDPGRDKMHGRVWRITAEGRPLVQPPDLARATLRQLIDHLGSGEVWTRYQARRLLFDGDAEEVTAAVDGWLAETNGGSDADPLALTEAAGVLAAHGAARPGLLGTMVTHAEWPVRARAARLAGLWHRFADNAPDILQRAAADAHPRVRLEAVVAASELRDLRGVGVLLAALAQARDPYLDHAFNMAVRALETPWRRDLESETPQLEWKPADAAFFLAQSQRAGIPRRVHQWLADLDGPERAVLLEGVVRRGRPQDLALVLREREPSAELVAALVEAAEQKGLRPANPRDPQLGEKTRTALQSWLAHSDSAVQTGAARLAGAWNVTELAPAVRTLANDGDAPAALRARCMVALAQLEGEAARETLGAHASDLDAPGIVALGAVEGLLRIDVAEAARHAAVLLTETDEEDVVAEILTAFISRPRAGRVLADALGSHELDAQRRAECIQAMAERGYEHRELLLVFLDTSSDLIGLPTYSRGLVQRLTDAAADADPVRGRELYRTKLAACTACHAIDEVGSRLGPDLSNLGNNMDTAQIVESVLWPNRLIKSGYEALTILGVDGVMLTGYRKDENKSYIDLLDTTTGEMRRIYKRSIDKRFGTKSIMPQGLAAGLTEGEFAAVVKYLSVLGQPGAPTGK